MGYVIERGVRTEKGASMLLTGCGGVGSRQLEGDMLTLAVVGASGVYRGGGSRYLAPPELPRAPPWESAPCWE